MEIFLKISNLFYLASLMNNGFEEGFCDEQVIRLVD